MNSITDFLLFRCLFTLYLEALPYNSGKILHFFKGTQKKEERVQTNIEISQHVGVIQFKEQVSACVYCCVSPEVNGFADTHEPNPVCHLCTGEISLMK